MYSPEIDQKLHISKIWPRLSLTLADFLQVKCAEDRACMAGCPPNHHTV